MAKALKALWRCPKCGAPFVTKNIWHACGKYTLKDLFQGCDRNVPRVFRKFARMVRACGPVRMIPQKTRVVFMVRVRFAGAYPRKSHLLCGVALPRRVESPRFVKIESYSRHFHGHTLRISSEKELDTQVQRWLRQSYRVGCQAFLSKR
jgi:hypothetical protein